MPPRTRSLLLLRQSRAQRAHFAILIPSPTDPDTGSLINVVGAPMTGYKHVFERGYRLSAETQPHELVVLGEVDSTHLVDDDFPTDETTLRAEDEPRGAIALEAAQVPATRISENFMAPVNDTTKTGCQEWTMDFVRRLVAKGYINASAVDIVQWKRDPPGFGNGLRPVA